MLIVDDHADFRASSRALLELHGFDVVGSVGDGAAAIEAAAALRPDVVLLDVQLPDMDGFDVTDRLLEAGTDARIVLVSSRDRSAYAHRLADRPDAVFVSKGDLFGPGLATLL